MIDDRSIDEGLSSCSVEKCLALYFELTTQTNTQVDCNAKIIIMNMRWCVQVPTSCVRFVHFSNTNQCCQMRRQFNNIYCFATEIF